MANTLSQAQQIVDLLVEKLEQFDPTFDLSEGSEVYSQVVQPVIDILSVDPFDTDIEEFLLTRLSQEFPNISAQQGDAIVDLLVRPLQLLLESFKRELEIIRKGQSVETIDGLRLEDAEDLAGNFFVFRSGGARASGTVRVYFSAPSFVNVVLTAKFSTADGLSFFPINNQFYRPETLLLQRSGAFYYVDILVVAEEEGEEYNISAGSVTSVSGIDGAVRVANLFGFGGGTAQESATQLITRTRNSLTERTLNTRKGIRARLLQEFPDIQNMEVVGFGDPEMERDVMTGAGGGDVLASGMCFISGRYVLFISMFEDNGKNGGDFIKEGSELKLNFWKFLYDPAESKKHQKVTVEQVLYSSEKTIENIPTTYLLKIDSAPDMDPPAAGALPGVLPGVFAVAHKPAELTISNIPGGLSDVDDEVIVVKENEVHIGGHYDVYVRPTISDSAVVNFETGRSEVAVLEGSHLFTIGGEINANLAVAGTLKNIVHSRLDVIVNPVVGDFVVAEIVEIVRNALISDVVHAQVIDIENQQNGQRIITLSGFSGSLDPKRDIDLLIQSNASIAGVPGAGNSAKGTIVGYHSYLDWEDNGVKEGMLLDILTGTDAGVYKILEVDHTNLTLDLEMTGSSEDVSFRIIEEPVTDLFEPKSPIFPFSTEPANDLSTIVGSDIVKVTKDLVQFGVSSGDTLEILHGDNKGQYIIQGFDENQFGKGIVLDRPSRATDSNLEYKVYSATAGLNSPLIRLSPEGVRVIDASGQLTGYRIPPAMPVGAKSLNAFSGAVSSFDGSNGFVFPDPGPSWLPASHRVVDNNDFPAGHLIYQYSGGPQACYSGGNDEPLWDPCKESDQGAVAVLSFADMPNPNRPAGHDYRVHLDVDLPADQRNFLIQFREWLVSVVESFSMGDDFRAFVDQFAPITLDPIPAGANILAQYEILIPNKLWDGSNNVFLAIPEFDWEVEFSDGILFEEALDKFNNGEMKAANPALANAVSGDVLTIDHGPNAGSYIIDEVYTYDIYHGGTIQVDPSNNQNFVDRDRAYKIALVCIKDEFPVPQFSNLAEFMDTRLAPRLNLPAPPQFNLLMFDPQGNRIDPWDVVQAAVTWVFQSLSAIGFDLPDEFEVVPDETLKKITRSLFGSYRVGTPTCEQIIRLLFTEPTSITSYGNRAASSFNWISTVRRAPNLQGSNVIFPMPQEALGLPLEIFVTRQQEQVNLSAAVTQELLDVGSAEQAIGILQNLLDPEFEHIRFLNVEGVSLAIVGIRPGEGTSILVRASSIEDGFRYLGFYDDTNPVGGLVPSLRVLHTDPLELNAADPEQFGGDVQFRSMTTPLGELLTEFTSDNFLKVSLEDDFRTRVIRTITNAEVPFALGDQVTISGTGPQRDIDSVQGQIIGRYTIPDFQPGQDGTALILYIGANLANLVDANDIPGGWMPNENETWNSSAYAVGGVGNAVQQEVFMYGANGDSFELSSDVYTWSFLFPNLAIATVPLATQIPVSYGPSLAPAIQGALQPGVHALFSGPQASHQAYAAIAAQGLELIDFNFQVSWEDRVTGFAALTIEASPPPFVQSAGGNLGNTRGIRIDLDFLRVGNLPNVLIPIDSTLDFESLELSTSSLFAGLQYSATEFNPNVIHPQIPIYDLKLVREVYDEVAGAWNPVPNEDPRIQVNLAGNFNRYLEITTILHRAESFRNNPVNANNSYAMELCRSLNQVNEFCVNSNGEREILFVMGLSALGTPFVHALAINGYREGDGSGERLVREPVNNAVAHGPATAYGLAGSFVLGRPENEFYNLIILSDPRAVSIHKAVGFNSPGAEQTEYVSPHPPTLFSLTAGASELFYTATGTEQPFQVYPGQNSEGRPSPTRLPRDLVLGEHYPSANSVDVFFSAGAADSPILAGVNKFTDVLRIHEQRIPRELAANGAEVRPAKQDRVIGVITANGSNIIKLPKITTGVARRFSFRTSETGEEFDSVVPGDVIYIEEGDDLGGYRVSSVSDTEIHLNARLSSSTPKILASGNSGAIERDQDVFREIPGNSPFSPIHIGKFLTITSSAYEGVDGSYQIVDVLGGGQSVQLSLEDPFPVTDLGLSWSVTDAPVTLLGDSLIDGGTELFGLRPIRVYSGEASEWRIGEVSSHLSRLSSFVSVLYGDSLDGPVRGYLQPYEIVRPGVTRASSTAMRARGRDQGFYYFDVRAKSLGGGEVFNIPKDVELTPVYGTYESDGYRLSVEDSKFTYSSLEVCKLHLSSTMLPDSRSDTLGNKVILERVSLDIEHEFSQLVNQVQALLTSNDNRVLCADPLARHFIPAFVSVDIDVRGGSREKMASDIYDFILSLEPADVIDVSRLEKYLHDSGAASYTHPIYVNVVVHDLERRQVLRSTQNSIGGEDSPMFKGSDKITYYIPGSPRTESESSIPDGERILIRSR